MTHMVGHWNAMQRTRVRFPVSEICNLPTLRHHSLPNSYLQNQSNKGKRKDCTSGFIGVNYNIDKQKWTARLQFYGKRKDICYKDTAYECALAREKYIIENNLPHTRNFND